MNLSIVIFAKAPLPGLAKTRLVPALGEAGAAALAERMLFHTLAQARAAAALRDTIACELCVAPGAEHPFWRELGDSLPIASQGPGDLGARMLGAAQRCLARGRAFIAIGSDCPAIDAALLLDAADALANHDAVMAPTHDGGYALLGLRRQCPPALFENMPWSSAQVAELSLNRLAECGLRCAQLARLHDIDLPEDLRHLPPGMGRDLPARNAGGTLL